MRRRLRMVWGVHVRLVLGRGCASGLGDMGCGQPGCRLHAIPLGGNAATFIYYPSSPTYSNNQSSGGNEPSTLGIPAKSTTTETFGANPGEIEFYAMGGGAFVPTASSTRRLPRSPRPI